LKCFLVREAHTHDGITLTHTQEIKKQAVFSGVILVREAGVVSARDMPSRLRNSE
jgi:hypothetical protein